MTYVLLGLCLYVCVYVLTIAVLYIVISCISCIHCMHCCLCWATSDQHQLQALPVIASQPVCCFCSLPAKSVYKCDPFCCNRELLVIAS